MSAIKAKLNGLTVGMLKKTIGDIPDHNLQTTDVNINIKAESGYH